MTRKRAFAAVAAVVAVAVALPVVGIASRGDRGVTIATHGILTAPDSAAGTFAAVGDIDDSGAVETKFTLAPVGPDAARLSGSQRFTGAAGTFEATFEGIASPIPGPGVRSVARGKFEISGGTGAYEGIRGRGRFVVVGDFTTGQVYSTAEGHAG
jgi:hypothetical protein